MRLAVLQTSANNKKTGQSAFNPLHIVKIAEANNGNTFLDLVTHGSDTSITAWTIYQSFETVLAEINEALK